MINIGTIGSGFIVDNILSAMINIEEYNLVASYSRNIEKANLMKEKYGFKKTYDDLDEMLLDKDINTIYIASPNSLHFEQAKKALLAGKNVICEKPFVSRSYELEELIDLAKEKNLILFEAIATKYMPAMDLVKDNIKEVGKLSSVIINYSQFSSKYTKYSQGEIPNVFNSEFSGGALADLGIYNLHFLYKLFGMPKEKSYMGNINEYGVDLSGVTTLKYDDFIGSFLCAKDTSSTNFILIQGIEGYIHVDNVIQSANIITVNNKKGKNVIDIEKSYSIYSYELECFRDNFEKKDMEFFEKVLYESLDVIKIFEELKLSGNIKDSRSR